MSSFSDALGTLQDWFSSPILRRDTKNQSWFASVIEVLLQVGNIFIISGKYCIWPCSHFMIDLAHDFTQGYQKSKLVHLCNWSIKASMKYFHYKRKILYLAMFSFSDALGTLLDQFSTRFFAREPKSELVHLCKCTCSI